MLSKCLPQKEATDSSTNQMFCLVSRVKPLHNSICLVAPHQGPTRRLVFLTSQEAHLNTNFPPEFISTCTELQLVPPSAGGLGTLLSTGPPHQLTNIHHLPSRSPAASPAVSYTPHHYQKHYIVSDTVYSFQVVSCVK